MPHSPCVLIGAPIEDGVDTKGAAMGPAAFRTAGLAPTLETLGRGVRDGGDVAPDPRWRGGHAAAHPNPSVRRLPEVAAWTAALQETVYAASADGAFPIVMGGDHSLAFGALSALSRRASEEGRPFHLLWLDAHPDIHTLQTTASGNLHGLPIAYLIGDPSFAGWLPPNPAPIDPRNILMMGVRAVDPEEQARLAASGVRVADMRAIDEDGVVSLLRPFLADAADAGGWLHVTLDVDFIDPEIAPGVVTTVPGGATYREAHLIMEMVYDSGLARSLDLVELNPFLDVRGRTARLMVDLTASLLGRRVIGRPTSRASLGP